MNQQQQKADENGDREKPDPLDIVPANTISTLVRAEIDSRVATAKQYPRSIATFKKRAKDMATLDEETAAASFYTLPARKNADGSEGKPIVGPSVRLAEIVGSAWQNIQYGARVIADDGRMITAQGVCWDLENNISATIEVRRRVTNKRGQRYSDEMVVTTGNAACSIALRNAIFKVIPMAYVKDIFDEARRVAIGNAKTLETKRADMVAYFGKMGLKPERVFAAVGKKALEDVGLEELGILKGLATAIKDGDTTIEEAFPLPPNEKEETKPAENGNKPASKSDELAEKLKSRGQVAEPAKEEARPEAPKSESPPPQATDAPGTWFPSTPDLVDNTPPKPDERAEMDRRDLADNLRDRIAASESVGQLRAISPELVGQMNKLGDYYPELSKLYQETEQRLAQPAPETVGQRRPRK